MRACGWVVLLSEFGSSGAMRGYRALAVTAARTVAASPARRVKLRGRQSVRSGCEASSGWRRVRE